MNWDKLTQEKKKLDAYRPLSRDLTRNLEQWFLIELTYTSNAIEGNTLTRQETAVVVEKGLAVSGKSLVEHLEATNHASALNFVMGCVQKDTSTLDEPIILNIHNTILRGIDDSNAGHYRSVPVRISGSMVILPNPMKVPDLMASFISKIQDKHGSIHPVELAACAHYELVTIHPFVDGNGRTARLLMNLILMQNGYPPALIRKRDRMHYIKSLEKAQLGGSLEDYYKLIEKSVQRSFNIYLNALSDDIAHAEDAPIPAQSLMKIGQLAKATGQSVSTLRFWTQEGLLEIADRTDSHYQLYSSDMIERVASICKMKEERLTISEIKLKLQ